MKVIVTGIICSGKTTLANKFVDKGLSRLKEYTDRPMRNETEIGTYHFITPSQMKGFYEGGNFATYNKFFDYSYAISQRDFKNDNWVCAIGAKVVHQLYDKGLIEDCFLIKLEPPLDVIRKRMSQRAKARYDEEERIRRDMEDMESISFIMPQLIIKT